MTVGLSGCGSLELIYAPGSPLAAIERTCRRIARSDASVLLTGETGTGKEVFARFVHRQSPRSDRQLIPVNCGAIPEALLESELFGFVRGAFTGAVVARQGRVALAEGGTLFLDEVGELSPTLQVKLLRLLQERTYEPLGSSEPVAADFRLIAATHRDLAEEVRAGRFRRDLYYRLNVCEIRLPPLRERPGDIPLLFSWFWRAIGEQRPVDPALVAALQRHPWAGNVRELRNSVERLSVCTEAAAIGPEHLDAAADLGRTPTPTPTPMSLTLPLPLPLPGRTPTPIPDDGMAAAAGHAAAAVRLPVDLPRVVRELEAAYIRAALAHTNGNRKEAAALLGIRRTTLVEKLRRRLGDPLDGA